MPATHRLLLASALAAAACAQPGELEVGEVELAVEAYCDAEVAGSGTLDVENVYLPQVIACENGGASLEALKSQAVSARSYLYYKLSRQGSIGDGQGDQVYSCGNPAGDVHRQAAAETSGEILMYQGSIIAAFYVAGAHQSGPDCRGGTDDPTGTENYVTYNEGLSGDSIHQTTLGWVSPTNKENRGCQSQNGADCLSDSGRPYDDILHFYYGEDIELTRASGPCIEGGDDDEPPADDDGGGGGDGLVGSCSASGGAGSPLLVLLALAFVRRRRAMAAPAASR
jgi:hypothetical protein